MRASVLLVATIAGCQSDNTLCPDIPHPTCPDSTPARVLDAFTASTSNECGAHGHSLTNANSQTSTPYTADIDEGMCDVSANVSCPGDSVGGATASCSWDLPSLTAVIVNVPGVGGFGADHGTAVDIIADGPYGEIRSDASGTGLCAELILQGSSCIPVPPEQTWFRFRISATEDAIDASSDGMTWTTIVTGPRVLATNVVMTAACFGSDVPSARAGATLHGGVFICP